MKIAIGGMQKNEMDFAIKKAMPEVETVLTNDMAAVKMLKNGEVDYFLEHVKVVEDLQFQS